LIITFHLFKISFDFDGNEKTILGRWIVIIMSPTKVLVTGGYGYIGSHIVVYLAEKGYMPIIFDNLSSTTSRVKAISEILGPEKYFGEIIDLTKIEQVRAGFKRHPDIEHVIHLAGYKSVPESMEEPNGYYQNNIYSTLNLIEVMKEYAVNSIIFSSSCSVYGDVSPEANVVTEKTPTNPVSPYAHSKLMCEKIILSAGFNYCVILRYFNPLGCHPQGKLHDIASNNSISTTINNVIRNGGVFRIFGNNYPTPDKTAIRDYIHVMDVAVIHVELVAKFAFSDREKLIMNIGTGVGYSVLDIVNEYRKHHKFAYEYTKRRLGDVSSIVADNTRMKAWMPFFQFRTLEEMVSSSLLPMS